MVVAGCKAGKLYILSSSIESDFVRENLTILFEYGVPRSAIDKIEKYIDKDLNQDLVIKEVINKKIYEKPEFLSYEREKLITNYTERDV